MDPLEFFASDHYRRHNSRRLEHLAGRVGRRPAAGARTRRVVGEQQGAELWPGAFGIGPADDDKFLAVQTFDLEPCRKSKAVAGGQGRNGGRSIPTDGWSMPAAPAPASTLPSLGPCRL